MQEEGPFLEAAKKEGLTGSFREVLQQPAAKELLLKHMNTTAKEAKLKVGTVLDCGLPVNSGQYLNLWKGGVQQLSRHNQPFL